MFVLSVLDAFPDINSDISTKNHVEESALNVVNIEAKSFTHYNVKRSSIFFVKFFLSARKMIFKAKS